MNVMVEYNEQNKKHITVSGDSGGDAWVDLGLLMEGLSVVMGAAIQQKNMQKQEMVDYVKDYIDTAFKDYKTMIVEG